jgi:outer membrane protein OmpA-like peptidoglycan-associated protein
MKILITGLLILFGWSALSTHFYVCNIKGLCNDQLTSPINKADKKEVPIVDTLNKPAKVDLPSIPDNELIYFAFDKSEFNSENITEKYINESNKYLNQDLQSRLSITGYTDATGSDEYNEALGYRRAQSVQHYFESKGIAANKILIESKGEREPAGSNGTVAGRAANRRAVITIKH